MSAQEGAGPKPMGSTSEITAWWRVAAAIVVPVTHLLFRLRVIGADRLPTRGPGIVVANHVSMLDGPTVCIPPWRRGRMVRFLVAAEYLRVPVVGWVLRTVRQIPIRRGASDGGALDEAIATIRAGALAGVFPEGTVNRDPEGALQRIRTGVARIALQTGAPVYPIGIWGTQARLPRGGVRWARPARPPLTFVVGEPIEPPAGTEPTPEAIEEFVDRVRTGLEEAVARARRDVASRRRG